VVHCAAGNLESRDPDTAFHVLTGVVPPEDTGRWSPIDTGHAERILTRVLHRDLAYNGAIMPRDLARRFAREFLSLAPPGARVLTNAPDLAEDSEEWSFSPATEAAWDAGVLIVGDQYAAALWVEDED